MKFETKRFALHLTAIAGHQDRLIMEGNQMTSEERNQRIEELKQELSELRKVKSSHGGHKIDFEMLELEDQIAELRQQQKQA